MLDYLLTEEQQMLKELAHKIAEEKIRPVAKEYDESGEFPWDIMKILAQSDLFGVYIDEKYGGFGGGVFELSLVAEELSRACGGIAVSYAASALGTYPIILFGNDEQKDKYLPDIASGKKIAAFAITEPNAGSDASAMESKAQKDGDSYILNGRKQWITNGGEAETYVVIAMTNKAKGARGATAFILEKGMEGFEFGKKDFKWLDKFIDNIKHSYSCDIFIMPNIVIECDGDYWHKYPKGLDIDKNRNKELQEKGYLILRYWEREIKGNVQGVVDEIENVLMMTNNKKVYEVI